MSNTFKYFLEVLKLLKENFMQDDKNLIPTLIGKKNKINQKKKYMKN